MTNMMNELICDAISRQAGCTSDYDNVYKAMKVLLKWAKIARDNEITALEEHFNEVFGSAESVWEGRIKEPWRLLAIGISDLLAGAKAEMLDKILQAGYYQGDYKGRDALCACMIIMGVNAICRGEWPYVLERKMLCILPDEAEKEYLKRKHKDEEKPGEVFDSEFEYSQAFFMFGEKEMKGLRINARTLSAMLEITHPMAMVKLMQETDFRVVSDAIPGLSSEAKKRIMKALSERRGYYLYDEAMRAGAWTNENIESACDKMMKKMKQLIDCGDIMDLKDRRENGYRYLSTAYIMSQFIYKF